MPVTLQQPECDIVQAADKNLVQITAVYVSILKLQHTLSTSTHPHNWDLLFQKAIPLVSAPFGHITKSFVPTQEGMDVIFCYFYGSYKVRPDVVQLKIPPGTRKVTRNQFDAYYAVECTCQLWKARVSSGTHVSAMERALSV